jgi:hypothetical protein
MNLKGFFGLGGFQAEVKNKESTKPLGESVEACGCCMKVWSVVVQRELNLVVMEWMAAITGDCVGFFR